MRDELGGREQNLWQQMRALVASGVESKCGRHLARP